MAVEVKGHCFLHKNYIFKDFLIITFLLSVLTSVSVFLVCADKPTNLSLTSERLSKSTERIIAASTLMIKNNGPSDNPYKAVRDSISNRTEKSIRNYSISFAGNFSTSKRKTIPRTKSRSERRCANITVSESQCLYDHFSHSKLVQNFKLLCQKTKEIDTISGLNGHRLPTRCANFVRRVHKMVHKNTNLGLSAHIRHPNFNQPTNLGRKSAFVPSPQFPFVSKMVKPVEENSQYYLQRRNLHDEGNTNNVQFIVQFKDIVQNLGQTDAPKIETRIESKIETKMERPDLTSFAAVTRSKRQTRGTFQVDTNDIPLTCKDMCGVAISLPCSCDPTCLVYGNCCEGFTDDCPDEAKLAEERYLDFLDADVSCSMSNVFVITSCRKESAIMSNRHYDDRQNISTIADFVGEKSPIFDNFTKLVFMNQTIFECNQYPESKGYKWGNLKLVNMDNPMIRILKNKTLSIEEITYYVINELIDYEFVPANPEQFGSNNCITNARDTCPKDFISIPTIKEYNEKCQSFKSYVKCNDFIYANFYCMKCAYLFNGIVKCKNVLDMETARGGPTNAFSMLLSLSDNAITMEIDDESNSQDSWSSVFCDGSTANPCKESFCVESQALNSFNECKNKIAASFSMYVKFDSTKRMLVTFGNFLKCEYRNINLEITNGPTQSYEITNHEFIIRVHTTYHILEEGRSNFRSGLLQVRLEKVLQKYLALLAASEFLETNAVLFGGKIFYCSCDGSKLDCELVCEKHNRILLSTNHTLVNQLNQTESAVLDECSSSFLTDSYSGSTKHPTWPLLMTVSATLVGRLVCFLDGI